MCAGPAASFSPRVPAEAGCLFAVVAGVHVFISGKSLYLVIFLWLVVLLFLIDVNNVCSQRALILVLEHMGNFGVRLPPGWSRHGVSVHCLCVQMLSLYATG